MGALSACQVPHPRQALSHPCGWHSALPGALGHLSLGQGAGQGDEELQTLTVQQVPSLMRHWPLRHSVGTEDWPPPAARRPGKWL